jgi:hypothetical protein
MPITIDNAKVSDLAWDDEARVQLEQALAGASSEAVQEAYSYISRDGSLRVGPHHEVQGDVMVVSRDAVYGCASRMRESAEEAAQGMWGEGKPFEEMRLRRSERVKALQHLGRHMRDMEKVWMFAGE